MSDKFGSSDNAYFTGKGEILKWLNTTLKLHLTKIEQACTGAVYCQIIDAIHGNKVKMNKINWKATLEHEFISNLKLLQQSLLDLGIKKDIDIQKLSKGKYQDNFEFLQWLKGYFDNKCPDLTNYDPVRRRSNAELMYLKENSKSSMVRSVTNRKILQPSLSSSKFNSNQGFNPMSASVSGSSNTNAIKSHHNRTRSKNYNLTSDKLISCIDKVNIEGSNSNNKRMNPSPNPYKSINTNANQNNTVIGFNSSNNGLTSNAKSNANNANLNTIIPIEEVMGPSWEEKEKELKLYYESKYEQLKEESNKNKRENSTLKMLLAEVGKEKEFYYSKLKDFEFLVNKPTSIDKNGLINLMAEILYSERDGDLIIDEYGNPTLKPLLP